MTREEPATEASEYYYNDIGLRVAFEEGAQWADEHPKCPWISVNDRLPDKIQKKRGFDLLLCRRAHDPHTARSLAYRDQMISYSKLLIIPSHLTEI